MQRILIAAGALCCVAALAFALPFPGKKALESFLELGVERSAIVVPPLVAGHPHEDHEDDEHEHHDEEHKGHIEISQDRIEAEGITLAEAGPGTLDRTLTVPGTVVAERSRVAKIAAKVIGTVAELRKRLGDPVAKDEVVAILDSREVADAKSEYVSALVNADLQETLLQRQRTLYQKQISAEQNYLRAQATNSEAQVRVGVSRQKLEALGVRQDVIDALARSRQSATGLQRYEIMAPLAGRIVGQSVDLGTPVGGEGQAQELYEIADLSTVWVDMSVAGRRLADIREGQRVSIADGHSSRRTAGTIIFTGPTINESTRTARVIASVENKRLALRPGSFVSAEIFLGETQVGIKVPKTALQTLSGDTVVFIRTREGFEPRKVVVGGEDRAAVEIVSGLAPGDRVASSNAFLLKAEMGKSEATHSHSH